MTRALTIGLVTVADGVLARAAASMPRLALHAIGLDEAPRDDVLGLIVDAPLGQRTHIVTDLSTRWHVPILIEAPVGVGGEQVVSANPLRYGLHTRALIQAVGSGSDALETMFVAWRFRPGAAPDAALPLLIDFARALCPAEVARITALERGNPSVLIATFRYRSGALATLELGEHLPHDFPALAELTAEWFSNERAYSCAPGNQSVHVYANGHMARDWQPDPSATMVSAFADWLGGGPRPAGSSADDRIALDLAEQVGAAANA